MKSDTDGRPPSMTLMEMIIVKSGKPFKHDPITSGRSIVTQLPYSVDDD